MRFATRLTIRIKNGFLPHFTNEIYKRNCGIRNIELIENESLKEYGANSRRFAEKYNWNKIIDKFERILEEIIGNAVK